MHSFQPPDWPMKRDRIINERYRKEVALCPNFKNRLKNQILLTRFVVKIKQKGFIMNRIFSLVVIFLYCAIANAASVSGVAIDAYTKKPLYQVAIKMNSKVCTFTDKDGKFTLDVNPAMLTVQSPGFITLAHPLYYPSGRCLVNLTNNPETKMYSIADVKSKSSFGDTIIAPNGQHIPMSALLKTDHGYTVDYKSNAIPVVEASKTINDGSALTTSSPLGVSARCPT
jgi:hypothetical protein